MTCISQQQIEVALTETESAKVEQALRHAGELLKIIAELVEALDVFLKVQKGHAWEVYATDCEERIAVDMAQAAIAKARGGAK